jgi:hypothetical protein
MLLKIMLPAKLPWTESCTKQANAKTRILTQTRHKGKHTKMLPSKATML